MNIFKTLAELLSTELTATIVVKNTAGGKMTVITNFNTEKGGVCDTLAPFTLKGTPEELDEGYLEAITAPVAEVTGLISNFAAFQKSVQQAEKNAKASPVKGATPSKEDVARKLEEERKRKEAEAKARKENFDKAMSEAKVANAHGNYYTAEAIFNFAATLTDDKKLKSEITRIVKTIAPNKEGFLCSDDENTARTALDNFKASMVKPDSGTAQQVSLPAETLDAPDGDENNDENSTGE